MRPWFSSLVALGAFGPLAAGAAGTLQPSGGDIRAPFLECGAGVSGRAGVVVVHLLGGGQPQSGNLSLEAGILAPQGVEWAGNGTIRIETNAGGHPSACQATAPSPFHLRATAARLAGTRLRVLGRQPVRVEIQDARGKILASRTVDPSAGPTTTIGW